MERSWSQLPPDLLSLISHKLPDVADFARFRCVCSSWRSAADPNDLPPQPPWLMLPLPFLNTPREFFSLSAADNPRRLNLRDAREQSWIPANHGWLFTQSSFDAPFLFNPLTRSQIALPPPFIVETSQKPQKARYIFLAALSSNPSAEGATVEVMVAYSGAKKLAFCRPGEATWTSVGSRASRCFSTITYFNGQFYVMDVGGRVVACDLGSSPPAVKTVILCPERCIYTFNKFYLVESKGELLLVTRHRNHQDKGTGELFGVLKLIKDEEKHDWLRMKSIGDRAIFLSDKNSLAISASGVTGCRPDCIYFADPLSDYGDLNPPNLYFLECNIEDGSLKKIPCYLNKGPLWWQPLWLLPSLC